MFRGNTLTSKTQTYVLDELISESSAYSDVYKAHPEDSSNVVVAKIANKHFQPLARPPSLFAE